MEKLVLVEEAKTVLTGAMDWSILRWLAEKKRVRAIADRGTAALDEAERLVKSTWTEDLRNAYAELCPPAEDDPYAEAEYQFIREHALNLSAEIREVARRVKAADDEATYARLTAEKTFDDAERRMSASLARRGAEEAVRAYDIRYKAIAEAEAARGR